jgi:hypothetical protein
VRRLLALLLLAPGLVLAQSMEPRAYSNAPTGLNFLLAGYAYSQGDLGFAASSPLQDGDSKVHSLLLGYVRSLNLFGDAGSIAVLLPMVDLTATATLGGTTEARREISGMADPALRLAWNFYGAPALSGLDFGDYRQDLIVGTSLTLTAPFGQYEPGRLVNIGTNRWSAKPELGLSKAVGPGPWSSLRASLSSPATKSSSTAIPAGRIRSTRGRCTPRGSSGAASGVR